MSQDVVRFAAALLLGQRSSLQPTIRDRFLRTGTVHLLAVSGLHVGIIASLILFATRTRLIPWRLTVVCVMILIIGYAFLAEGRSPVVRAALLVQIVCLSWLTYRRVCPFNSLSAAALAILIRNPCELFQTGTQLSFLAVAVLASCGVQFLDCPPSDPLDRLIWNRRPAWWHLYRRFLFGSVGMLRDAAIWITTLPLVAQTFHIISPWSIILSVVLWIPVAIGLYAGLGVLVFHLLFPPLSIVCGGLCDCGLKLLLFVVEQTDQLPYSHFWVAGPSDVWTVLFYAALTCLIMHPQTRRSRKAWLLFGICFCTGAAVDSVYARAHQSDQLRCTFVAVGHGSCVLIELPDGTRMLYDAGRLGDAGDGIEILSRVLWMRGISRIDAMVISHADADHYNLVPDLLKRFTVKSFYTSPQSNQLPAAFRNIRNAASKQGIDWREIDEGGLLQRGDCRVEILHPPKTKAGDGAADYGTDNANSIVLRIDYRGHTILLSGDIESEGLERLMREHQIDADVVMAPHHGSPNSSPDRFADWCTPEWIVISSGNRKSLAAHQSIAERQQCKILHTAVHGAAEVVVDRCGLLVTTFLPSPP